MKKDTIFLLSSLLVFPETLFAVEFYENPISNNVTTIPGLVELALSVIIKLSIPVATIYIIYAGFLFITAQGNENQIKKAKNTLLWACIGLVALLGAWFFASAFLDIVFSLTS